MLHESCRVGPREVRSRSTGGKSLFFLFVILTGYISGTIHKLFYSPDKIIVLYILNGVMVSVDIVLYFRNRAFEKLNSRP